MKVSVNSNLQELRRQQMDAQPQLPRFKQDEPQSAQPAAVASISAQVATENATASRNQPLDSETAQALRQQIQTQPMAALNAHQMQADRIRNLLS